MAEAPQWALEAEEEEEKQRSKKRKMMKMKTKKEMHNWTPATHPTTFLSFFHKPERHDEQTTTNMHTSAQTGKQDHNWQKRCTSGLEN